MAKRYRRVRHRYHKAVHRVKSMHIPLAVVGGLAAGMQAPIANLMAGDYNAALDSLAWRYAGWNSQEGRFDTNGLMQGAVPLVAGILVSKLVGGTLGVNRKLGQMGVPFIRI